MILATAIAIHVAAVGTLAAAQQPATPPPAAAPPLVFDRVTVIDVERGERLTDQRVVVTGNRISAMGKSGTVAMPSGARVVDASGKYLIPGLWDLHVHPGVGGSSDDALDLESDTSTTDVFYPLFVANGVTGIRDAWSAVPIETQGQWWREILAGTRVGPPRQLLAGMPFNEGLDTADVRELIDSLKAAGVNFLKFYPFTFEYAAVARRAGLPFGGHMTHGPVLLAGHTRQDMSGDTTSPIEASDSGMRIFDHLGSSHLSGRCFDDAASVEACQPVASRFQRNGSWLVPTIIIDGGYYAGLLQRDVAARAKEFWGGALLHGNWLRDSLQLGPPHLTAVPADSLGRMRILQRTGMPVLAGTDVSAKWAYRLLPGFMLHAELAAYVAEGLTPLEALQSATFNPAKLLNATDSLGSVASGKLADLVLLAGDPLADITNTTTIEAVVANGRYFDRAALDRLLTEAQAKGRKQP